MEKFFTGSLSVPSYLWRLGVAFVIGGLVGSYTSFTSPDWLDVVLAGAALLVPPLLHVALDGSLRRSPAALAWAAGGALLLCLLFLLIAGPGGSPASAIAVMWLLAPVSASFAVGSVRQRVRRKWRLAVLCGVAAWLGVGIHNLLIPALTGYFSSGGPIKEFGDIILGLLIVLYIFGLLIAVLTGMLGSWLHAWLQRRGR